MINKIYSMLGLCMKAGKIVCGADVCIDNIKKKKAFLTIIAEDASQNTKEKFIKLSEEYEIQNIVFGEKDYLSKAVGKVDKVVFAIVDKNFADKIMKLLKEIREAIN